jgi:excisionase family DNA binding protein
VPARTPKAPSHLSPDTIASIRQRGLWRLNEVAEYLSIDRSFLYVLINRGALRTVHQGRRAFIPADSLVAYLAQLDTDVAADVAASA